MLKRLLAGGDDETTCKHLIAEAKAGEWVAVRFVMERLEPKPRGRSFEFEVPEDATSLEIAEAALQGVIAGRMSPTEALQLSHYLDRLEKRRAAGDKLGSAAAADAADQADAAEEAEAPDADLYSTCNLQGDLNPTSIPLRAVAPEFVGAGTAGTPTRPSSLLRTGEGSRGAPAGAAGPAPRGRGGRRRIRHASAAGGRAPARGPAVVGRSGPPLHASTL